MKDAFERLIDSALYTTEPLGPKPGTFCKELRMYEGTMDRYCHRCDRLSTWAAYRTEASTNLLHKDVFGRESDWSAELKLEMRCSRESSHRANYYFEVFADSPFDIRKPEAPKMFIVKVGQHPSLADFQMGDVKEFKSALEAQERRELVQAINTAAHGFAVAACVYYRRVFEQLIDGARDAWAGESGITDLSEFNRLYTDDKIKTLGEKYLPPFLVEHPQLYSILSKGVHQLSEQECAEALPTIREAIEIILREKTAKVEASKQRERAKLLLARTVDKHK